jgi:hypothetical protein
MAIQAGFSEDSRFTPDPVPRNLHQLFSLPVSSIPTSP